MISPRGWGAEETTHFLAPRKRGGPFRHLVERSAHFKDMLKRLDAEDGSR